MTTKQIFIASSSELRIERMELVDLIQDLEDELTDKGIKLKPMKWEYMDSSMRERRKEDEYLDELRKSEICIVLFWRSLGEYTVEELDIAVEEKRAGRLPKFVYVFYKEPAENMTKELVTFKENYQQKYADIPLFMFEDSLTLRRQVSNIFKEQIDTF